MVWQPVPYAIISVAAEAFIAALCIVALRQAKLLLPAG